MNAVARTQGLPVGDTINCKFVNISCKFDR